MVSGFKNALQSLADESQAVNSRLLNALSGPSQNESKSFADIWPALALERRRLVITKMVEQCEDRFDADYGALFRICLGDSDANVRRAALDGLWEDQGLDLVDIFIRMMRTDPDIMVRAAAASSLASFVFLAECDDLEPKRAARVRLALEQTITNPKEDPEVVRRGVEAISFINDDRVRDIIKDTYAQREEKMRVSALFAMGRNADPYWADIILEELGNASSAIRFEAARASGELQLKKAIPQLIELVKDADDEVQSMSIWALGQIGGKEAEGTLQQLSKSKNEALSEAAQEALSELELISGAMDMLVHNTETDFDELTEVNLDEDALDEDDDETSDEVWDDEPIELD